MELLQKLTKSETDIWSEDQKAKDPDTFDVLMAAIEKMKELEPRHVPEENLNNILKGLLFSQEMFAHSSMDFFYQQHKEKYEFLFNRGSSQDKIIFQGSSAEGLSILRIDEIPNVKSESSYGELKWRTLFDFDILCVKDKEVIDVDLYGITRFLDIHPLLNPCKHSDEPLFMTRWGDWTGEEKKFVLEHVILCRPCCKDCMKPREKYEGVTVRHEPMEWYNGRSKSGRLVEIYTPFDFYLEFCEKVKKNPHPERNCDMEYHGKFGDLCGLCRVENSVTVQHTDGARTDVFMDQIGKHSNQGRFSIGLDVRFG